MSESLYRYMSFESFGDTVQRKQLHFVHPSEFEDPMEFQYLQKVCVSEPSNYKTELKNGLSRRGHLPKSSKTEYENNVDLKVDLKIYPKDNFRNLITTIKKRLIPVILQVGVVKSLQALL